MSSACDFLLHLFEHESLAPSSIESYRSAINSVWQTSGRSLTGSYHVTQLLRSFRADRPRSAVVFPKWDLNLVLRVLSRPPFHPVEGADPFCLSAKTAFLLLLASARRRGDIHAIDPKRVTFTSSAAILEPSPRYLPKIRTTAEGEARYAPIVIRALTSITQDRTELSLCPVTALRAYDEYANKKSPNREQFFVSTRSKGRPVSKATLSAWIVKLLRRAYREATEQDARLASTSVHEIRALSTSLTVQSTFALSDVLKAASWASPSTFADFYLRDVSGLRGQLHVLSPCVIAGETFR